MVRVAHVSDVHITASPLGLALRDFLSKRFGTLVNLRLHRGKNFRLADEVALAFERDCRQRGVDSVIFSGDATNFGLPSEMARAAEILGVGRMPGLAVPGNHDYLVKAAERSGAFERCFAPWQQGERLDGQIYPFAQKVGEVWFIG
ncbi:MAG: metallophosphoesterase, partial [Planctomycetota bacterium]